MNEVVKYNNYLNSLQFKDFTGSDYDLLMFLCAQMRDQDENTMTFSLSEIRIETRYDHHATVEQFAKALELMNKKLMQVTATIRDENKIQQFVLFPTFTIDLKSNTLTVRVNPDFKFLLNALTSNFTKFELAEFVELNSKYSKTLYRLLKQYRSTGEYHVKTEELRKLLGCPESYENKFFMLRIINPTVAELQKEFPLLTCEAIRARTKGRPITGYHFKFETDGQIPGQVTLDQAAEEMQKYKASKAKKGSPKKKNAFNDFSQREYDFNELEKAVLSAQQNDK